MNNMLTFEEVQSYLDVEQKQLESFLQEGKLHAYRIGGTYIRFRKEDVETLRYQMTPRRLRPPAGKGVFGVVYDFWRFNNFYILSLVGAVAVIYWWVRSF